MTANVQHRLTLNEVLDEIATASNPPDEQMLRAWTVKYPDFAAEIVEFATDWVATEVARPDHIVPAEEVDLVVNRTMSRVQAMLDAAERPETLTDLAADIRAAGHDFDSFQRAVGIDRSILDCLIARLIKSATVPVQLVHALAGTLNRSLNSVRDYLRLPPQLVAAYKARARPEVRQVDFATLVEQSQLSDAEKARWLADPPDPVLRE